VLSPFGQGVWLATQPVRILGTRLTSTMTVLRLNGDELLLHSPIALTPERVAAVASLGRVCHLYAPNLFHHLSLGQWATQFPAARVHAPKGLTKKRPDLRVDRVHDQDAEPAFAGVLDELPIAGCRLAECALYYRPARALVVADLVHNVGRPSDTWSKIYTQSMGFYGKVALSRVLRWTAFSDRAAARASLERVLQLPFERLIVGHGAPLASGAQAALQSAFTWLPSANGTAAESR
jgi:hypothetical protein